MTVTAPAPDTRGDDAASKRQSGRARRRRDLVRRPNSPSRAEAARLEVDVARSARNDARFADRDRRYRIFGFSILAAVCFSCRARHEKQTAASIEKPKIRYRRSRSANRASLRAERATSTSRRAASARDGEFGRRTRSRRRRARPDWRLDAASSPRVSGAGAVTVNVTFREVLD